LELKPLAADCLAHSLRVISNDGQIVNKARRSKRVINAEKSRLINFVWPNLMGINPHSEQLAGEGVSSSAFRKICGEIVVLRRLHSRSF
jgi:hypothetical protein